MSIAVHPVNPTFSVIIPSYNRAQVINRAIQSALAQTFVDFELIIVDDGSMDNTADVVAKVDDKRVRYVCYSNRGVSAARNTGVTLAKGKYVTFLDSDDEVLPQWLEHFHALFSNPQVAVACCGFLQYEYGATVTKKTTVLPQNLGPLFCNQIGLFAARAFAVRRDVYIAVGGYVPGLTHSENTELGFRLAEYCTQQNQLITSTMTPLAIYHREATGGARAERHLQKHLLSSEYILAHHADRLGRVPKVYGYYLAVAGVRAVRLGDYPKARHFFWRAIKAHPINARHYGRYFISLIPPLGRQLWSGSNHHVGHSQP